MSDTPLLLVRDLQRHFPIHTGLLGRNTQWLKALDGVSLNVWKGRTVGVVGESGCGKSTLARTILLLERAHAGSIYFQGEDIFKLQGAALKSYRRQVQIVFQDPYASLPARMSVQKILTEPLAIHGIGDETMRRKRATELLEMVGMRSTDLSRFPHQFSGGQRQRISIARALALEPHLLICDEPVSALDVSIQAQVLQLLLDLQRILNLTYLFISHDLRVVKYICDDLVVMYLGRVVETGPTEQLFAQPAHPYTLALIRSIPSHKRDGHPTTHYRPIKGDVPSPINAPSGCHFHPRCPLRAQLGSGESLRCTTEVPIVRDIAPGRQVACHFAEQNLSQS